MQHLESESFYLGNVSREANGANRADAIIFPPTGSQQMGPNFLTSDHLNRFPGSWERTVQPALETPIHPVQESLSSLQGFFR
jgi:hypothetical protein